jgi:hypothetical protein
MHAQEILSCSLIMPKDPWKAALQANDIHNALLLPTLYATRK